MYLEMSMACLCSSEMFGFGSSSASQNCIWASEASRSLVSASFMYWSYAIDEMMSTPPPAPELSSFAFLRRL